MAAAGEFARLAALRPLLSAEVGDDAAVVAIGGAQVVVCADAMVHGVHFTFEMSTPEEVGWKLAATNLSDLAAMGAVQPRAALVTAGLPEDVDEAVVRQIYVGLQHAGERYGLPVVGGDTVRTPVLTLSLTALGEAVGPVVRRGGARVGDRVALCGPIGAARAALDVHHAGATPPESLRLAHARPTPLLAAGRWLAAAGATALIDVSDGLGQDAGHVAAASGVALVLDGPAVEGCVHPDAVTALGAVAARSAAIGGGDDYALLATLPADAPLPDRIGEVRLVPVGEVRDGPVGAVLLDGEDIGRRGWDHG